MENKHQEKEYEGSMPFIMMAVVTGLVGGILWSTIGYITYYFNFIQIEPNIILEPFTVGTWRKSWIGIILSIFAYGIISMGVAIVYYALLKRLKTLWIGAGFGILLFLCVFVILNPIFPSMKPLLKIDLNTIITSVCLYVLYGVFIGFSISYEQNERSHYQNKNKEI